MTGTDEARKLLREDIAAASYEFTKDYQRKRGVAVPWDLSWNKLPDLQKKFGYAQVDWLFANIPALAALAANPESKPDAPAEIIAWLKAQSVHPFGGPPYTTVCALIAKQLENGEHLKPNEADIAAAEHVATRSTKQ